MMTLIRCAIVALMLTPTFAAARPFARNPIARMAEDKARGIAMDKGRDYYALSFDWVAFAKSETAKGNPPKNSGAAFLSYCKKQEKLR